jgi:tetratricopeptide (TPR) repeat protein
MTVTFRPLLAAHALAITLAFPAAAQTGEWDSAPPVQEPQGEQHQRPSLSQAAKALQAIRTGQYSDASRSLNTALKFDPENAYLHFLNGYSYHLLYSQGAQANRELAETAYSLALRFAPDHALSAFYLGLLHLDARQYTKAQASFAHALLLERDDPAALQALAVASYYAHDLGMAQWAIQRLEDGQVAGVDNLKAALRSAALIYAAAGRFDDALKRTEQYRAIAGQDAGEQVRKRVKQWQGFHASNPGRLIRTASQTVPLAPEAPSDPEPAPPPTPASPVSQAPTPDPQANGANGNAVRNWSDCPQNATPPPSSSFSPSYSYDNPPYKDETTPLPALPAPCDRRFLPRMALLDTAIISTYERVSSTKGVNLLDGLRLFLTTSFKLVQGTSPTREYARTLGLDNTLADNATSSASILAYSLNIANTGNEWNQVLARPTLVSLDRQPSTFFSGNSIATAVPGNATSTGTLVEHPAGISLSVTPTFIDDETLLLSVRVTRSFFAGGTNLKETVTKSRNAVSANVLIKLGETLILSGLTERQSNETRSGVPVMQDIPMLQYLFSNQVKDEFTQSVLVMVTPRPPATGSNAPLAGREKPNDPRQAASLKELREQIPQTLNPVPNLDTVFLDMEDNRLFREFRAGDLRAQDWRRPPFIERTLRQVAEFLYY